MFDMNKKRTRISNNNVLELEYLYYEEDKNDSINTLRKGNPLQYQQVYEQLQLDLDKDTLKMLSLMFLFGVLCLVATTLASPLELPPAPEALITIVPEHELRTNLPQPTEVIQIEKDNSKEEEAKVIILDPVPEAPVLPPMHETVREYLNGENKELRILKSRIPNISYPGLPVIEMLGI